MCVFFRSMCFKILIKRWFWEIIVLIGSLIELHVGLHLCLCFFSSWKTGFKSWLDTSSIPCCLSSFFSFFLSQSSIASWYLVDRSSFCSWFWWVVPRYLLNTSAVDDLFLDSYLDTSRYLHLSSFTEDLYISSSRSDSHFFDLSRSIRTYSSPKHSLSHSKTSSSMIFQAFSRFSYLGKLLISHSSCISCFET